MPNLTWIGKEAVVKHHKAVPFRLIEPVPELSLLLNADRGSRNEEAARSDVGSYALTDVRASASDADEGVRAPNLIVEGDNLHALKALLPRYAGQVKCIYIDPPYNTGNEGWAYNDNVKSPEILKWLGEVVGKEGETLDRHDRWLSMMYPRLLLLKQFLREDGVIFVSIDDNEVAALRLLMNEIFGAMNFVASIIWQKKYAVSNDHKSIAPMHDFVIVYQKSGAWKRNLLPRGTDKDGMYKYEDEEGVFRISDYTCNKTVEERPNLFYPIVNPNTGAEVWPKRTRVWAYSQEEHLRHLSANLIDWGRNGTAKVPSYKRYKHALKNADGIVPQTFWTHDFAGHTDAARKELREVLHDIPSVSDFATPKPSQLIQRILQIATDTDSLILDSFAGSGTTGHAVLKQNAEDGGNRRFILVEMDPKIAKDVTATRVRRVATGYTKANGDKVAGLGGGFQYCRLSAEPLFEAGGPIRKDVTFAQLAEFVWFMETGAGQIQNSKVKIQNEDASAYLGTHRGRAVFLLYNGILKDKSDIGGNVLNGRTLEYINALVPDGFDGERVIYAARSRFDKTKLAKLGITFHQLPYDLAVKTWF